MDLAELKFVVDTKQLEEAAKQIEALGTSVSKLNKPMQEFTKESAKTSKELSKAEEAAAKASLAQVKLEQAQTKSVQATGKSNSVLERQNLILEYMAQGNSKGQSSILATAKAAGALDDEMLALNKTLTTQRTLIGGDPFDKSIGLMQKLQNEYKTTSEVTNLFNRNLGLTEKQMIDLAREKERLIALYGIEGKSLNGLSAEYEQLIQKSVRVNQANDARINSMKAQVKAQDDAAKANAYLAKEMERVNRLNAEGDSIGSATNNRLIKFEQALKASGDSAEQQAAKLAVYRKELLATQKAAGDRQVNYLSRALGPQITDVFVGLATGQAPLTILLQQGGQLRDQFALAGVAGKDMGDMLTKATLGMVSSVKDVAIAVGSALGGAFIASGKAVNKFVGDITGVNSALEYMRYQIALADGSSGVLMRSFKAAGAAIQILTGVIVGGAIAALVAFGVAIGQVISQESALSKSLALTGASLGITRDSALALSEELAGSKGNVGSYVEAITAIAKAGGVTSDNLKTVASTIVDVSKITGISIKDLAKNFSKISEKPTEALIGFAKELGTIDVAILKQVQQLEKAGDSTTAATLATEAYSKALKDAASVIRTDMGAIETIFYGVGSAAKSMWDSILNVGRKGTLEGQMKDAVASLIEAQNGKSWYSRFGRTNEEEVKYYEEIVQSLGRQINAEKQLGETKAKNAADAKKFEEDNKSKPAKTKKETKELTDIEKERAEFLKVVSDLEDRASGFTKQYSDQLNVLSNAQSRGWLNQEEFNMKLHELNKVQPSVIKAHKDRADAIEKEIQAQKKADDALGESWSVMEQLNKQILDQTDLLVLEGSLIGVTDAERKKALGAKRLDLQLEKELADIKKRNIPQSEKDDQENQARQRRLAAEKNLNKEIANDFAAEMQKQYDAISNGLTDATITALFEGGKSGSKKLRDLVVAELKKPITIVVKALVDATLGNLIQSFVGGSSGDAVSSFTGSATGSAATGGLSGLTIGGASIASQASAFGAGVANGFGPLAGMQSGGLATSTSYNLGATYGAPAAGVLAGVYGGRAISGGYSAMGGASGNSAVNIGTAAGAVIGSIIPGLGTALGAAIGGALGGAFNRTFGTKLAGIGIEGTLGGASGFEGNRYTFEKGGLLRSNKYTPSLLEEADRSAIASDFRLIKSSVMELAETAGFGSDAIKDFTQRFAIDLMGLSPEDATKKYQEEFAKIEESMAKAVIGTTGYRRENETNVQALTRLSTFMGGINDAFKKLGFETYKLELASIDAAQGFVDLFGGIEGFTKTMSFFYDNFFSDTEKVENLTADLTTAFGKLNKDLPKTREEFKQMVIAAKAAGDNVLVKNLTDLQYAFAELVPAASTASKAIAASAESINEAYKNLKASALTAEDIAKQRIDLERKLFEATATNSQLEADRRNAIDNSNIALYEQIKAAENVKTSTEALGKAQDNVLKAEKELTKARADSLSSFISATKGYVDSLRKYSQSLLLGAQSTLTPEQKYTTSKAQLDSLIKIATGTANTPEEIAARDKAASSIEGAATAFLEASRTYNASSSQYTEDFNFVQQAISLTASALEAQVTDAQKQLGALGNIDVGISAVETAVNNLAAAQREVAIAQQAFNAAVLAGDVSGLNNSASSAAASVLGSAVVSNGIVYGAQGGLTSSSTSQFKTDVQNWMNQTAAKDYFTANPDVASMYAQNSYGMTKDAFAQTHYKTYGMAEGRVSPDVEAQMVKDLYAKIVGEWGLDSATLAQVMGTSQQSILDYFTPYGLPAFAKGTNYVPDDMYAKIHQGERIIPAADNTRLFQSLSDRTETNAVLVTEIRNLRQEIVELREQQSQETATIVVSNLDAQQRSADTISSTISSTSQESNWNSKVRESVKLK